MKSGSKWAWRFLFGKVAVLTILTLAMGSCQSARYPAKELAAAVTKTSRTQEAGSLSLGASLVDPDSLQSFMATGARTIWPGLPFEWRRINPSGDKCNWDSYDKFINALPTDSVNIIGRFVTGSGWERVSDRRSSYAARPFGAPRDLAKFRKFVYNTVRHYRGKIHYWQLLDEPFHPGVWLGSAAEYGQLLKTTWSAAKQADPSCKVLPGSLPIESIAPLLISNMLDGGKVQQAIAAYRLIFEQRSGSEPYPRVRTETDLRGVLKIPLAKHTMEFVSALLDNDAKYLDMLSFHDYGTYPSPDQFGEVIDAVCAMVRAHGIKQIMYLTGTNTDFNANDADMATAVAVRMSIAFSRGIDIVLWWSFKDISGEDRYNAHAGLVDSAGRPKLAYLTYQAIGRNMARIQFRRAEPMPLSGASAVRFRGDKGEFVIAWSTSGSEQVRVPISGKRASIVSLVPQSNTAELGSESVEASEGYATFTVDSHPVMIAGS